MALAFLLHAGVLTQLSEASDLSCSEQDNEVDNTGTISIISSTSTSSMSTLAIVAN